MLALQWNINDAKTAWQQEARNEGRFEEKISNIKRLMNKMHMSIEEAMEFSEIPEEDRKKYIAALDR